MLYVWLGIRTCSVQIANILYISLSSSLSSLSSLSLYLVWSLSGNLCFLTLQTRGHGGLAVHIYTPSLSLVATEEVQNKRFSLTTALLQGTSVIPHRAFPQLVATRYQELRLEPASINTCDMFQLTGEISTGNQGLTVIDHPSMGS